MKEYASSVLTCNVDEDGCAVCEFLNGDKSVDTLMDVISALDAKLTDSEAFGRAMTKQKAEMNLHNSMIDWDWERQRGT